MPKSPAQLDREIDAATNKPQSGKWEVEAGRGLVFVPKGEPGRLMFNLHRAVDRNGHSNILPHELDQIAHEIAAFLSRKRPKMAKSRGY